MGPLEGRASADPLSRPSALTLLPPQTTLTHRLLTPCRIPVRISGPLVSRAMATGL